MKTATQFLLLASLMPAFAFGCACSATLATSTAMPAAGPQTPAPARHPLKGVVVYVMPEQSALLVKHEEIPGVMKAMTMMLKVCATAVKSAKKGDAITGMLVRKADGWWLEDVKPATGAAGAANGEL